MDALNLVGYGIAFAIGGFIGCCFIYYHSSRENKELIKLLFTADELIKEKDKKIAEAVRILESAKDLLERQHKEIELLKNNTTPYSEKNRVVFGDEV